MIQKWQTYISTKHLDSKNVELLSSDVLGSHVDITSHSELGTDGSGGDTVLSGTGLSNNSLFTQSLG